MRLTVRSRLAMGAAAISWAMPLVLALPASADATASVPIVVPNISVPTSTDFVIVGHPSVQLIGDGWEYAAGTENFVHPDPNGVTSSAIYAEALVYAGNLPSPGVSIANATGSDAQVVGQIGGSTVYFDPSTQPGAPAEIQWLVDPHTQVTIGTLGSDAVPVSELMNLAAGLQLVPTGQTLPSSQAASGGSAALNQPAPDAQPKAVCDSTCPTAANMRGTGSVNDDWNVNHTICSSCSVARGNMVGVWQGVLWADGATFNSGVDHITNCDVDGLFGTRTELATEDLQGVIFQSDPSFQSYGTVESRTWTWASQSLKPDGTLVAFRGGYASLYFSRSTSANAYYTWSWNYSPYYYTGYTGIQIVKTTTGCTTA